MSGFSANNRLVCTDVTLFSVSPISASDGSVGTAESILGYWKSADITLQRHMVATKALSDTGYSERATSWDKGTFTATGFELASGATLADVYAAGSRGLVQATLSANGRQLQVEISMHELKLSFNDNGIDGQISASVVGVPQITASTGGMLAPMPL
ncbi:MAG: hypothetical protein P4L33_16720 [Capsulimonadaceae bacterium]|nr:hypothetical protein [Capsulimonadaceae bacterium]